jgi:hypothetical protein
VAGGVVVLAHCWVLREQASRCGGVTLVARLWLDSHHIERLQLGRRARLWYAVVMVVDPSVL